MHHTRNYSNLTGAEKRAKAIQDCKDYCEGTELFEKLQEYLKKCETLEQFEFGCAFVGIQGYPVHAMWEEHIIAKQRENNETAE